MSDTDLLQLQPRVNMGALKGVRLSSADGLVLSLADGSRSVEAILKAASLPRDQVLDAVRRLREAGVLESPGDGAAAARKAAASVAEPVLEDVPFVEIKTDDVSAGPPAWVRDALGSSALAAAPQVPEPATDLGSPAITPEAEFLERVDLDPQEPEPVPVVAHPAPARKRRAEEWKPKGKTESGSLKAEPIHRLLRDLYNDKRSGLLRIENGADWRELYLFRGHPNYVKEPNPKYKFGESLERSGLVASPDIAEAQSISKKERLLLGLVLVELGSLTEFQIKGIVRTLVEVRLSDLFGWDKGTWSFTQDDRERDDLVLTQVDMSRILFFGLKTKFPWEKARIELERDQDRYMVRNSEMAHAVPRLKLAERERRFFDDVIDGSRTLRQVIGYSTLKGSATWQLVHAFVVTGFIKFQERAEAGVMSDKAAIDLGKKLATFRGSTHFDILEIHWTALDHEVRTAYERLCREYSPDRKEFQGCPQEVRDKAKEILARLELAYRAVHDAASRRAYRDTVIPTDKIRFAATFNAQQAKNFKFMGDMRQAKECLDRARELIPGIKADF